MEHKAIYNLYPNAKHIIENDGVFEVKDENFNVIEIDMDAVNAKAQELQTAIEHEEPRAKAYPSIQDQLDMMYWDKQNNTTTWEDAITKVKTEVPKNE